MVVLFGGGLMNVRGWLPTCRGSGLVGVGVTACVYGFGYGPRPCCGLLMQKYTPPEGWGLQGFSFALKPTRQQH